MESCLSGLVDPLEDPAIPPDARAALATHATRWGEALARAEEPARAEAALAVLWWIRGALSRDHRAWLGDHVESLLDQAARAGDEPARARASPRARAVALTLDTRAPIELRLDRVAAARPAARAWFSEPDRLALLRPLRRGDHLRRSRGGRGRAARTPDPAG
ncbi:MAG: hypothetical protein H6713_25705 [Myxococcales bacterium]|nr:hypothetical protein [Myxococcales bacterium]